MLKNASRTVFHLHSKNLYNASRIIFQPGSSPNRSGKRIFVLCIFIKQHRSVKSTSSSRVDAKTFGPYPEVSRINRVPFLIATVRRFAPALLYESARNPTMLFDNIFCLVKKNSSSQPVCCVRESSLGNRFDLIGIECKLAQYLQHF